METFFSEHIGNASGIAAYCAIFGVLVACGLGVPLPEDISLLTGGFLAHTGHARLPFMMGVGFLGILAGDSLIYLAGRRIGSKAGASGRGLVARVVTPDKRAKVESLFGAHGEKIVMVARFLPGVRAVTYFTAGSAGMRFSRFILWDGLAALISAPLLVFLGFKFGDEVELIIQKVRHGQVGVIVVLVVVVVAYVGYKRFRAFKAKAKAAAQERATATAAPAIPSERDKAAV